MDFLDPPTSEIARCYLVLFLSSIYIEFSYLIEDKVTLTTRQRFSNKELKTPTSAYIKSNLISLK